MAVIAALCTAASLLALVAAPAEATRTASPHHERFPQEDCVDYQQYFRWLGHADVPGCEVLVEEDLAYVANVDGSLTILELEADAPPAIIGHTDLGLESCIDDLRLRDGLLYVASGFAGLIVVDVSNPAGPWLIAHLDTGERFRSVDLMESYLYVAGADALRVFDVSDPANPQPVPQPAQPRGWPTEAVRVIGSVAVVTIRYTGLQVFDLSSPAAPSLVGEYDENIKDGEIAVASGAVLVVGERSGLMSMDVSNPSAPLLLDSLSLSPPARKVVVVGSLAMVSNGAGATLIDVTDPAQMVRLVDVEVGGYGTGFSGELLVVPVGEEGLHVLDVGSLADVEPLGSIDDGAAEGVAVDGGLAVTMGTWASVFDIADPKKPQKLSRIHWRSNAGVLVDRILYMAAPYDGLMVFDLGDPRAPVSRAVVPVPGVATDLAICERDLYLVDQDGLRTFRLGAGGARLVAGLETPGYAQGVVASERLVVVADGVGGLHTIPVGTSAALRIAGTLEPDNSIFGVALSRDSRTAYALEWEELLVVDVSNPAEPVEVSRASFPLWVQDVRVVGERLFVIGRHLFVFDIREQHEPVLVGFSDQPESGFDIEVLPNGVAAVADWGGGLLLMPPVCDPAAPVRGGVKEGANVQRVSQRKAVWPNPFSRRVSIDLSAIAPAGAARVCAYDAAGRCVRILHDGPLTSGHTISWDARDGAGEPVAAGVYFLRLERGAHHAVQKVVYLGR